MYRIGIDVGGTFTDLVAVDDQGRVVLAKAASTPSDPSLGVMEGLNCWQRTSTKTCGVLLDELPSASSTARRWPRMPCWSARGRRWGC